MYIGGKQATRTENYTMCFATGHGKYSIYYVNGIPPLGLYFALFWYMANFLAATNWMKCCLETQKEIKWTKIGKRDLLQENTRKPVLMIFRQFLSCRVWAF